MLTVRNLTFSYGRVRTLKNVSLELLPGEVTCIVGHNGAGKTTLLNAIMGLRRIDSGSVSLDGEDLTSMSGYHRSRRGLALVPQGRHIFPNLTVRENLRVGFDASPSRRRNGIPAWVFEHFPKLREKLGSPGGDLSGGQQQQLAIARALVSEPKALLLDEPTEGIQPGIRQQIGNLLRTLAKPAAGEDGRSGIIVVLVEQNLKFTKDFGDMFYPLVKGEAKKKRPIKELTRKQSNGKVNLSFSDEYFEDRA